MRIYGQVALLRLSRVWEQEGIRGFCQCVRKRDNRDQDSPHHVHTYSAAAVGTLRKQENMNFDIYIMLKYLLGCSEAPQTG